MRDIGLLRFLIGTRHADVVQRHAEQRGRLALAGRDEHVHLSAGTHRRHLGRETNQLVGLLAHRAHDDHHLVAVPARARDMVSDLTDAFGVRYRGATELLDNERHRAGNATRRLLDLH